MKVVHISFDVYPCSAVARIQETLVRAGVDSNILVLEKRVSLDRVVEVRKNLYDKVKRAVGKYVERQIMVKMYPDKEPVVFSPEIVGHDIVKEDLIKKADIIHLHWVCGGYQSIDTIANLIKLGKPIVWTMHDSWAMTGGCHVRYGCSRYQDKCGKCIMLHSDKYKDLSYIILNAKKRKWKNNHFVIVTPSKWLLQNVKKSSLFSRNRSICIPNPLDVELFSMKQELQDRENYVILFGANGALIPYKGFQYFEKVLLRLAKEKPNIASKIVIRIFGAEEIRSRLMNLYRIELCGYISELSQMAKLYQNADVYFFPSLDDNLPGTVMESLACGTPVLAFKTGGVPDMVEHKKNGYIAGYKDGNDLYEGLLWIYHNNQDNVLGRNARRKVEDNYTMEKIGMKYKKLYLKLLNEKRN